MSKQSGTVLPELLRVGDSLVSKCQYAVGVKYFSEETAKELANLFVQWKEAAKKAKEGEKS